MKIVIILSWALSSSKSWHPYWAFDGVFFLSFYCLYVVYIVPV